MEEIQPDSKSLNEQLAKNEPALVYQAYEMTKNHKLFQLLEKVEINGVPWLQQEINSDPSFSLDVFQETENQKIFSLLKDVKKNNKSWLEDFASIFPGRMLAIYRETGNQEIFKLIQNNPWLTQYVQEKPHEIMKMFLSNNNDELFDLIKNQKIKSPNELDENMPLDDDLCDNDSYDESLPENHELLFHDKLNKNNSNKDNLWIKEYCNKSFSEILKSYQASKNPIVFDLLKKTIEDKQVANLSLDEIIENLLNINDPEKNLEFFNLIDKQDIAQFADANTNIIFPFCIYPDFLEKIGIKKSAEEFKEILIENDLATIANGFLKENYDDLEIVKINLTRDEDLKQVEEDLDVLYNKYLETIKNKPINTLGSEMEILNNPDAELRPPVSEWGANTKFLAELLRDIAFLTHKKFNDIYKTNPDKFTGYPHSGLHLSFNLNQEQEKIANDHKDELEDINYLYALAHMPFSRISYLEENTGIKNSIDTDVEKLNPETTARYQVRCLSIGGTIKEIKSSLKGFTEIVSLMPKLFDSPQYLQQVTEYLKNNTEIQNKALELKWIIDQANETEIQKKDIGNLLSNLKSQIMETEEHKKHLEKLLAETPIETKTEQVRESYKYQIKIETETNQARRRQIAEEEKEIDQLSQKYSAYRNYFIKTQEIMQIMLKSQFDKMEK